MHHGMSNEVQIRFKTSSSFGGGGESGRRPRRWLGGQLLLKTKRWWGHNFSWATQSRQKRLVDLQVGPRVAPPVGPQMYPRVQPQERPRQHPRELVFLVFSPSRTPNETSLEGVHGIAHESVYSSRGPPVLVSSLCCSSAISLGAETPQCPAPLRFSGTVSRDAARLSQRYPFMVSQHDQLGGTPPPPALSLFPLGEHAKRRCDNPPQRGISAILARYHMKTRQNGCNTTSAAAISTCIMRYGGYLALGC